MNPQDFVNFESVITTLVTTLILGLVGGLVTFWRKSHLLQGKVVSQGERITHLEDVRIKKLELDFQSFLDKQNTLLQDFAAMKVQIEQIQKSSQRIEDLLLFGKKSE